MEHDLIISRALVELFSHPLLRESLAFRGSTALYKLYLTPAARYSEDIDLVQVTSGPAGPTMDALRAVLDPWLGKAKWKQTSGRVTLIYRFQSGSTPSVNLRLKVEINTREHFAVLGYARRPFEVASRWYAGQASVTTFELDELLATKLRALYQRSKGRDLFDLAVALEHEQSDPERMVGAFRAYMEHEGHPVTRAMFERNLDGKLRSSYLGADLSALVAPGREWHLMEAAQFVTRALLSLLPGEEWRGPKVVEGTPVPEGDSSGRGPAPTL